MENYNRAVIELYKKSLTDFVNGSPVDENAISETQRKLNFAIDKANMDNEPTEELEALKKDVEYLKYDLF